jgi:hypothetical protein
MNIPEMLTAAAVTAMLSSSALLSSVSMQKSFVAADHYATSQSAQARVADFLDLDMRRATEVVVGKGNRIVWLSIPDYYAEDGSPRMPVIVGRRAVYGDAENPVEVVYEKRGSTVVRSETRGGETREDVIAEGVEDFEFTAIPARKDVSVSVTFKPKFRNFAKETNEVARANTRFTSHTFTRNIEAPIAYEDAY